VSPTTGGDLGIRRVDGRVARQRRRVVTSVIVVLLVTSVLNLAVFRAQEGELADPHRAAMRNPSDRLLTLTEEHGRNVGSRFLLYVWLGDRLTSPTIVVAPGYPLSDERLLGLAGASIEVGAHEPQLDGQQVDELFAAATRSDWLARGRFVRDSSSARTGVPEVFRTGDFAVVLPDDGSERADLRLLTFWEGDRLVLIEEGEAVRRGLAGAAA
jgi:hypothetical protein